MKVVVEKHRKMNSVKGTFKCPALSNSTESEILEAVREQDVIKVERMKRFSEGKLSDTHRYIFTFNRSELPQLLKLTEWHYEILEEYIPPPTRCSNCQKFGHLKKWCKKEEETCARCSVAGHRSNTCENYVKCANCGEDHYSTNRKCPEYIRRSEIMATKIKGKLTFREAEDEVRRRYHHEGRSFSSVVKRPAPYNRTQMTNLQDIASTSTQYFNRNSQTPPKSNSNEQGNDTNVQLVGPEMQQT